MAVDNVTNTIVKLGLVLGRPRLPRSDPENPNKRRRQVCRCGCLHSFREIFPQFIFFFWLLKLKYWNTVAFEGLFTQFKWNEEVGV